MSCFLKFCENYKSKKPREEAPRGSQSIVKRLFLFTHRAFAACHALFHHCSRRSFFSLSSCFSFFWSSFSSCCFFLYCSSHCLFCFFLLCHNLLPMVFLIVQSLAKTFDRIGLSPIRDTHPHQSFQIHILIIKFFIQHSKEKKFKFFDDYSRLD